MNTSSLVNAVIGVGGAYLAVLNTNTLVMAVLAYVIGTAIVSIIAKKLGLINGAPQMEIVEWVALAVVVFIFYRKYGLLGALGSLVLTGIFSFLLGILLIMF